MKGRSMKRRIAAAGIACLVVFSSTGNAQQAIFLVRHAEKETNPQVLQGVPDQSVPLSAAGKERAKALASHLKNAGIDAVYTSFAKRTKDTAAPLATAIHKDAVEITENDVTTLGERHKDQIVLIVGHSAGGLGVPRFIDLITGKSNGITIKDDEFDKLFILLPKKDGSWSVTQARYGKPKPPPNP
jgi:hypothetical protein